jgi:hypothetical protein
MRAWSERSRGGEGFGHSRCDGALRPKHLLRHVVPPQIRWLDVAEHALGRAMARLAHQVGELGPVVPAGGEQAAAERMAGEPLGIQPGRSGGLLPACGRSRQRCRVLSGSIGPKRRRGRISLGTAQRMDLANCPTCFELRHDVHQLGGGSIRHGPTGDRAIGAAVAEVWQESHARYAFCPGLWPA